MTADELITRLKAAEATLPHPRTAKSEADQEQAEGTRRAHAATISLLANLPGDLASVEGKLAELEGRRAETVAKLASLEKAILDAPPWREHDDGRVRDQRYEDLRQLRAALKLLREGTLLKSPGVCFDRLEDLDFRIRDLTVTRDRTRVALDSVLAQAEQLLAVTK